MSVQSTGYMNHMSNLIASQLQCISILVVSNPPFKARHNGCRTHS